MNIWVPNIGDDSILVEKENGNIYDEYAVCIRHEGKIAGHVPINLSKTLHRFLSLPRSKINCVVTGRRVNRGAGYGLEIPVRYTLVGAEKAVEWAEKVVRRILDVAVSKTIHSLK